MIKYIIMLVFSLLYLAGYAINFMVAFAYEENFGDESFVSLYPLETIDLISSIYSLPVGLLNLLTGNPVWNYWLFTAFVNLGIFLFSISWVYEKLRSSI